MATCSALTAGRALDCKDAVGGIKKVFFCYHENLGTVTEASDIITDIAATTVFKYELPTNTGSFTQTINSSVENGTVFWQQDVNIKLHKLSTTDRKEIKLLAQSRLCIFVFDSNNNLILAGQESGAELTAGTHGTGVAKADMNGYDLTFTATSSYPAKYLTQNDSAFQGITTPGNITIS